MLLVNSECMRKHNFDNHTCNAQQDKHRLLMECIAEVYEIDVIEFVQINNLLMLLEEKQFYDDFVE